MKSTIEEALDLLCAVVSPTGTISYDFETLMARYHADFETVLAQPKLDHISMAYMSAPIFLHTCTSFGNFMAANRTARVTAINAAIDAHNQGENQSGTRAYTTSKVPLMDLKAAADAYDQSSEGQRSQHDPYLTGWYSHFVCEKLLMSSYKTRQIVPRTTAITSALVHGLSHLAASGGNKPVHDYLSDFSDVSKKCFEGLSEGRWEHIAYNGRINYPVETHDLIRCYIGLVEIYLRSEFLHDDVSEIFKKMSADRSFYTARLILFLLGVESTPYAVSLFLPEILFAIEKALNPRIPPVQTSTFSWNSFYPPSRLVNLVKKRAVHGNLMTARDLNAEQLGTLENIYSEVSDENKLLKEELLALDGDGDTLLAFFRGESELRGHTDWAGHFDAFRQTFVGAIAADWSKTKTITEHLLLGPKQKRGGSELMLETTPFTLDNNWTIFAASLCQNEDIIRGFSNVNVYSYCHSSLCLRGTQGELLPYQAPEKYIYGRWHSASQSAVKDHFGLP